MSDRYGDIGPAVDRIVEAAMHRQHLPGVAVAVAAGGRELLLRGYGLRNVGEGLPVDPDTTFSIASVSKQFTVAALLQLAERGLLRIDDPVHRYFPWLNCDPQTRLEHLLTHTSGIPDYFPLDDLDLIGFTAAAPREIAERATAGGISYAPGAEYQYCNTAYVLLGAIIERVAGMSYADYLTRHLFEPLRLTRTGVDDRPAIRSNVAIGYTSFALGEWELARDYHPSWEFATGGLYSTVRDVLRWNRALRSGRVVRPQTYAQMTTSAIRNDGQPVNYGFGLALNEVAGLREVRHTGGLPGMSTDNATYPDADIDIVVFVNHDGCSTYATIARRILAVLQGGERFTPVPAPRAPIAYSEPAQARDWLRVAVTGALSDIPVCAKFARFLTPERLARLAALAAFGELLDIRLVDANRRAPETTFVYCLDFAEMRAGATLTVRDDGKMAGLTIFRWDERE